MVRKKPLCGITVRSREARRGRPVFGLVFIAGAADRLPQLASYEIIAKRGL